jgi:hypothetical protein
MAAESRLFAQHLCAPEAIEALEAFFKRHAQIHLGVLDIRFASGAVEPRIKYVRSELLLSEELSR